jgi:hypothetical protein
MTLRNTTEHCMQQNCYTESIKKRLNYSPTKPSCSKAKRFQSAVLWSDISIYFSFVLIWNVIKNFETSSDREIINKCLEEVADVGFPDRF